MNKIKILNEYTKYISHNKKKINRIIQIYDYY